jgi:hypothetical protein
MHKCVCGSEPHADWSYSPRRDISCDAWRILYKVCHSGFMEFYWGPNAKDRRRAELMEDRGLIKICKEGRAWVIFATPLGLEAYNEARVARWAVMDATT